MQPQVGGEIATTFSTNNAMVVQTGTELTRGLVGRDTIVGLLDYSIHS